MWRRCALLFAICDAELRCIARRAAAAFAASPLLLVLAAAAFAALPGLSLWAGSRAAPSLRAADPRLLATAAGLVAALAGAVVTLLAPGPRALGRQLEAAPVPRAVAFAALTAFPVALAVAAFAPAGALFAAPVAAWRTPLVLARLLGAAALGGAAAEALLALGRRSARGLPVAAGVGLLAAAGWRASLAPFALVLWAVAAAARPTEPPERGAVALVARTRAGTAVMRYARRRELRRQAFAACAFAVGGAIALRVSGAAAAGAVFGAFTAALGAAIVPLAAPGLDRRAEWVWRTAPVSRLALALLYGAASIAVGLVVALVGAAASLIAAPTPPARLLPVAAAAALVLGSALLAGALAPWRSERFGEQLGAYAAFGVVASLLWAALAWAAPRIGAEQGVAAGALACVGALTCLGAASLLQARRA